ncbi:MAG: hypothetical protein R3D57_19480 [Hyphomicrobiaceae bacterium]
MSGRLGSNNQNALWRSGSLVPARADRTTPFVAGILLGGALTVAIAGLGLLLTDPQHGFALSAAKDDARLAASTGTTGIGGTRDRCTALALDRLTGLTVAIGCTAEPTALPRLHPHEIES